GRSRRCPAMPPGSSHCGRTCSTTSSKWSLVSATSISPRRSPWAHHADRARRSSRTSRSRSPSTPQRWAPSATFTALQDLAEDEHVAIRVVDDELAIAVCLIAEAVHHVDTALHVVVAG